MNETTQAEPSFRITVNPPVADSGKPLRGFQQARKANEDAAATILARRTAVHQQHRKEQAEADAQRDAELAAAEAQPPVERENIESIEFTTPEGLTIVYGPPNGVSLVDRIARLYSGREVSMAEHRLARILMGVRSINGTPVDPFSNDIGRTLLANKLGDQTIDLLMYYDRQHFPALRQSEIPEVKKNLRV